MFEIKEIFKKLNFRIIPDDFFEEVVELSCQDAFDFSAIVGANYLLCENGISMKGRNEIFIHRSVFHQNALIYTPGLFGRDQHCLLKDENSGDLLGKKYPEIFKGSKKLILHKLNADERTNIETDIINKIIDLKKDPKEYLLFKYADANRNLEPFIEWVVSRHFIEEGFIFENQCPFFQQSFEYKKQKLNGGIPDVSAFKIPAFKDLSRYGIVKNNKGILINKIPHLINFNLLKQDKTSIAELDYKLILGEVKSDISSVKQAEDQLLKYQNVDLAEELYLLIPNLEASGNDLFGIGYFHENKFLLKKSVKKTNINKDHQIEDERWLEIYLKINLLGNLPFERTLDELMNRYKESPSKIYSWHLLDYAVNTEMEEILKMISNYHGIH
jgi:hypothetical protein